MNKRIAMKKAKQVGGIEKDGLDKQLAGLIKSVPAIHHAVEEIAEDNITLMQAVKRASEGQDALLAAVLQEFGQLRADLAGELIAHALRTYCRELSLVLHALEGMLERADFSDGGTIRHHIESLAMTLSGVLGRMGIERVPIVVGV